MVHDAPFHPFEFERKGETILQRIGEANELKKSKGTEQKLGEQSNATPRGCFPPLVDGGHELAEVLRIA
jgi:hypothetical protein